MKTIRFIIFMLAIFSLAFLVNAQDETGATGAATGEETISEESTATGTDMATGEDVVGEEATATELAGEEMDESEAELEAEIQKVGEKPWWTGGPILEFFKKGGIFMWPLLLCSIIGVVFIIERLWAYHSVKMNTADFTIAIKKLISKGDIRGAIKVCENQKSPIAAVIKSGLLKFGKGRDIVENAVATSAVVEASRLERGLSVLATIANIAPLIGFLGTVSGMISSFDVIAKQGLTDPGAVAGGISEALITTASGLTVAIPMLAAYNYFTGKVARFTLEMEESSNILLDILYEIELQKKEKSAQAPKGTIRRDLT